MIHEGPIAYFACKANWNDMSFIWCVLATLFLQRFEFFNTDDLTCKLLLVITASTAIIKTFFFMRIFKELSYLVTMIFQVFIDLTPFLLFYLILIVFFSLYFGILGLGNFNVGTVYRNTVIAEWKEMNKGKDWIKGTKFPYPSTYQDNSAANLMPEYQFMPKFFAYWFSTFNVSLGNFDFGPPDMLNT